MGLMSRTKSTGPCAGGGSLETSAFSAATTLREQQKSKTQPATPHIGEAGLRLLLSPFISIEEEWLSVGAVNGRVATRRPTCAETEERGVVDIADIHSPGPRRSLHLSMASEA